MQALAWDKQSPIPRKVDRGLSRSDSRPLRSVKSQITLDIWTYLGRQHAAEELANHPLVDLTQGEVFDALSISRSHLNPTDFGEAAFRAVPAEVCANGHYLKIFLWGEASPNHLLITLYGEQAA